MVDRKLRKELLSRLGVTRQALSQRAKRIKDTYGPMSTDEAVYVIAHLEGIDITKYLQLATVDRVRALMPRSAIPQPSPPSRSARKTTKTPKQTPYPLVPLATSARASTLGSDVYPALFELENSIRALVERVLSPLGSNWWDTRVPNGVKQAVQRTMNREQQYPYREKRGPRPLHYTNFDDLRKIIIEPTNWPSFQSIIVKSDWFNVKMEEVYMARNNLAHCVPLSADDKSRILILHRDWARLLAAAGIK
jgi:hypothetical protein